MRYAAYWKVHAGLGVNMSAEQFGAIPIDPYSHSPAHAGAQQPGMTGAVKEEILTRRRELGVAVTGGQVEFDALLVRSEELLDEPTEWVVAGTDGGATTVALPGRSVASTLCQVPVVVTVGGGDAHVDVDYADGRAERHRGRALGRDASAAIFGRTGEVVGVRVMLD